MLSEGAVKPVEDDQSVWHGHHEIVIDSVASYLEAAERLAERDSQSWLWRGQCRAVWPLASRLHRTFPADTEAKLLAREQRCLLEARNEWRLGRTDGGARLSAIELLALLQHHGTPTRLLDFSRNCLVALWFAVTPGFANWRDPEMRSADDSADGRVFAIDESDSSTGKTAAPRELSLDEARGPLLPWTKNAASFSSHARTWTPEALFPRIDRQLGCFVLSTTPPRPKRDRTSLQLNTELSGPQLLRLLKLQTGKGRHPGDRLVLFRVPARNKPAIRKQLERSLSLTAAHLYPDPEGFAATARWQG